MRRKPLDAYGVGTYSVPMYLELAPNVLFAPVAVRRLETEGLETATPPSYDPVLSPRVSQVQRMDDNGRKEKCNQVA